MFPSIQPSIHPSVKWKSIWCELSGSNSNFAMNFQENFFLSMRPQKCEREKSSKYSMCCVCVFFFWSKASRVYCIRRAWTFLSFAKPKHIFYMKSKYSFFFWCAMFMILEINYWQKHILKHIEICGMLPSKRHNTRIITFKLPKTE